MLVTCKDERHQAELLEHFHAEGLEVKALLSDIDEATVSTTVPVK